MNKKYIDFVPTKAKTKVASSKKTKPNVETKVIIPKARVVPKKTVERKTEPKKRDAKLGVIEDVGNDSRGVVASKSHFNSEKDSIRAIKAKKIGSREVVMSKASGLSTKTKENGTYKTPKTPFINQDKIVKRPLSKNVYQKKVEIPKEEPKGPVTIITKPEKQAHVSIIITIILTIILGAAAGTVAFLLLPK